jgi:hypothetical protein
LVLAHLKFVDSEFGNIRFGSCGKRRSPKPEVLSVIEPQDTTRVHVEERAWHRELNVASIFLRRVKWTCISEEEGPVIDFVEFQQGVKESTRLTCFE